jgi:hypothetical protein
MTKDEALKLALEALELHGEQYPHMVKGYCLDAITAIKEALAQPEPWEKFCDSNCVWTDHHPDCKLAQPEQEPVAYIRVSKTGHVMACAKTGDFYSLPHKTLLYTTPPQRKPLTGEMTKQMRERCDSYEMRGAFVDGWVSAEAAHGIKGEA